tara:strand:- start:2180 stop:2683 length:504 start_codon:yes stop_codon:yes gene_type:complete
MKNNILVESDLGEAAVPRHLKQVVMLKREAIMPTKFEVKYSRHHGYPTIEILKNGEPFWEELPGAKKHFRFGVKKSIAILACMHVIKNFYETEAKEPIMPNHVEIDNHKWNVQCTIRRYNGFKIYGKWMDKPYLEIQETKPIKFGHLKAQAIVELEKTIEKFVIDNY